MTSSIRILSILSLVILVACSARTRSSFHNAISDAGAESDASTSDATITTDARTGQDSGSDAGHDGPLDASALDTGSSTDASTSDSSFIDAPFVDATVPDSGGGLDLGTVGITCGGRSGGRCAAGQFCNIPIDAMCGITDGTGVCDDIPELCTRELFPVCGCDGMTYPNPCLAAHNSVSIASNCSCDVAVSLPEPAE